MRKPLEKGRFCECGFGGYGDVVTTLTYMVDFDVFEGTGKVVSVSALEDGRFDVVLDETCFYARGGGQDWDTGQTVTGTGRFIVGEVRLDERGDAHHMGTFETGAFSPGEPFSPSEEVSCSVDIERRTINTRLHSAGHVIDMAVDQLGLPWIPGKGAHYPHMSNVEYASDFSAEDAAAQCAQIEAVANKIIAAGGLNEIRFMPVEEMHTICRHVPDNLPTNKPARVVIYGGDFGVPCGGTHVRYINDVGPITIPKVKAKKGIVKVSYAL